MRNNITITLLILLISFGIQVIFPLPSLQNDLNKDYIGIAEIRISISENNETANISDVFVVYGDYTTPPMEYGEFMLQVEYNGLVVYESMFSPEDSMFFYDSLNSGGFETVREDSEFSIPFYDDSEIIKIYKDDRVILSTRLSDYICDHDQTCDENEDYLTCPDDCRSGQEDGLCDRVRDGICDPDCFPQYDIDCICGDGKCQEEYGEDFTTCCQDCGCPEETGTICSDNGSCRPPETIEEYKTLNPHEFSDSDLEDEGLEEPTHTLIWSLLLTITITVIVLLCIVFFLMRKR